MKNIVRAGSAMLLIVGASHAQAICYNTNTQQTTTTGYRWCKSHESNVLRTVTQSETVEGNTRNGARVNTPSGSKQFKYATNSHDYIIYRQDRVNIPNEIKNFPKTVTVSWPKAAETVPCGVKARWELNANLKIHHWVLETKQPGGNWKGAGLASIKKEEYKNGIARFRNLGKFYPQPSVCR